MNAVTHRDIVSISDDLLDCIGLNTKALDQRVTQALDKLDAKQMDAVAHVLGIAALVARRMATERGRQEDAEQEREQAERVALFTHPPQRRIG